MQIETLNVLFNQKDNDLNTISWHNTNLWYLYIFDGMMFNYYIIKQDGTRINDILGQVCWLFTTKKSYFNVYAHSNISFKDVLKLIENY